MAEVGLLVGRGVPLNERQKLMIFLKWFCTQGFGRLVGL